MVDRARLRVGRPVSYTPTAAEAAASGEGPWPAVISDVNADGSADLLVVVPGDSLGTVAAALASPLITSADASDLPSAQTLANELKADVNIMATLVNQL